MSVDASVWPRLCGRPPSVPLRTRAWQRVCVNSRYRAMGASHRRAVINIVLILAHYTYVSRGDYDLVGESTVFLLEGLLADVGTRTWCP